jgi:hypothetical protein
MNILAKLGDAIDSTNQIDNESVMALGFFAPTTGTTDSRSTPAYSTLSRRRSRQRRFG